MDLSRAAGHDAVDAMDLYIDEPNEFDESDPEEDRLPVPQDHHRAAATAVYTDAQSAGNDPEDPPELRLLLAAHRVIQRQYPEAKLVEYSFDKMRGSFRMPDPRRFCGDGS